MRKISTKELINLLQSNKNRIFEVSLSNGYFVATHIIYWGGRKLYDTGIDSKEIKWKADKFLGNYPQSYWKIEQVI